MIGRSFGVWRGRVFFGAGGPMGGVPHAGRHRPEQRQRHDQDEAVEPSGKPDLAVFEPEARLLKSENMASMPQRRP